MLRHRGYRFDRFTLDLTRGRLLRDRDEVKLRPKSFRTLVYLVEHSGRLIDKEELMRSVWPDAFVSDESLAKCITDVRVALGDESHRLVQTVSRRGYVFVAKVTSSVVSLAILPFMSPTPGDYLGIGIADALITRLSKLPRLVVRPTGAVVKYAAPGRGPIEAGRELGVDFIIDGSVYQSGDGMRVTVCLLGTRDGEPVWADAFDARRTDMLGLQDAVTERIAAATVSNLTGDERRGLTQRYTDDPAAYELYLKGRYCWSQSSPESLKKAIGYFEQAASRDPEYALAYTGIADSYLVLGSWVAEALRPCDAYPKAKAAALEALRLDDNLAEAHTSYGGAVKVFDWNWPEAESAFRRAIDLDSAYATAHQWYAMYFAAMGRLPDALAEITLAHGADPLSRTVARDLGRIYFFTQEYKRAIAVLEEAVEFEPAFVPALFFLGNAYAQVQRYDDALRTLETAVERSQRAPHLIAAIAHLRAMRGEHDQARALMCELQALSAARYVSAYNFAIIHAALGEQDRAFDCLEQTYRERSNWIVFLRGEPRLDPLRSDRRFGDLMRRVGLA